MNNLKSKLVKLVIAFTLALTTVVAVQAFTTNSSTTQTVQAARKLSKKEKAAKRWIALRESGGSYIARNGNCYGKYQLSIGYLHGDLSPKNQERVADNYVYSRYGSWANAKRFWLAHHWY
ncbi:aggregation promoting factor surface protein [Lactobacillus xujianguonis]|uniref:Aggregation promoting factor surface protein n=2 Tax=Lactobacillaceae TaxID=33958 RepID=A0A437SU68_9LACO|nr:MULTISPECIES: aggregation promoting factor surface protein [Lactobacillus]RVU70434.1 aggregation promoting factor surface protein [Lactobacillus xujianguonis]RVU73294.1 aggregation promoting factor surface protein [Lactobacillus xujianguonis]